MVGVDSLAALYMSAGDPPCEVTLSTPSQDLLSGQFNVTLGEKITEHLKKWVDAEKWISPQPPQPVGCYSGVGWGGMLDMRRAW